MTTPTIPHLSTQDARTWSLMMNLAPPSQENPPNVRLLIANDNPVVRAGLVSLLEGDGTIQVVAEAAEGQEAIARAERTRPDLALMDMRLHRMDGLQALQRLSALTRVIMLAHTAEPDLVQAAVRAGAYGYLVHGAFSVAELSATVHNAVSGTESPLSPAAVRALMDEVRATPRTDRAGATERFALTEREVEILNHLTQGLSNTEIAELLMVAEKTVKNHVTRIFRKLEVK